MKEVGMTCGHCEKAVKGALNESDIVQEVQVDLDTGNVTVSSDENVQKETMAEAIEEQGYDVVS
ncbi:cation transporter [Halobacillus litoralis]|uniref:cation transporter n=1 Tax=Halobacillus litoralis TaxID=45668 RepID=UPI001CFF486E|nr:cation transporter [Halobacillus litoralis]